MCTGSDSYRITENWVCGNFTARDGGGIGHIGYSDGRWERQGTGAARRRVLVDAPLIKDNFVIFNESFFQGQTVSGGGIFIGGAPPLTPGGLTPGSGNVQVVSNLIQGNAAGAGDGGGIRLAGVNGQDVATQPEISWYAVNIFNNMIVNNVAGLAGGGMSLQDAVKVRIVNNTIANNDSLATAGEAFAPGSPNQSTPQPGAGIVTRGHSTQLQAAGAVGTFSNPAPFADNIIWQNRQFFFFVDDTSGCTPGDAGCTSTFGICPDVSGALACPGGNTVAFDDLAVIGATACLSPTYSILTNLAEDAPDCSYNAGSNNQALDPQFVAEYFNGARSAVFQPEVTTGIQTPAAFDEGGNFIRPRYGPLSLYNDATSPGDGEPGSLFGDYHILSGSSAVDTGTNLTGLSDYLDLDYDGESRPFESGVDIGADELHP
jgi:hypothetical protein